MAWRIALIVGAVLAVACAGLALYVDGQPSERRCTDYADYEPGHPRYREIPPDADPDMRAFLEDVNDYGDGVCARYGDDAPLPILRSGTATWWWFASAAIAVLTLASIPLLRRARST